MIRPRDQQRSRAYRFEHEQLRVQHEPVPISPVLEIYNRTERYRAVQLAVEHVWLTERDRYGVAEVQPPKVQHRRLGSYNSGYLWILHTIHFTPLAHFGTVLHEVAHAIVDMAIKVRGPEFSGAHGPEFVGTLIGLYIRHAGIDRAGAPYLVSLARKAYRLKVDDRWIEGVA